MTRFLVVLVTISGLGYGGAMLTGAVGSPTHSTVRPGSPASASASTQPAAVPPAQQVLPAADPLAPVTPPPALLKRGDTGPQVRALQSRLRQLDWYAGDVTDTYGPKTATAVKGFQHKRGLPALGYVDQRTMKRLKAMTHTPTTAELENKLTPMGNVPGKLDPRCLTGRALCIDKSSRTLRWVVDGQVRRTVDVRFGSTISNTPTREGLFHVYWKDANHVSREFGSAMPFSMFFSRGQAVHYSSDFAARGYSGASHGCVNVRDYDGVKWLFGHVQVGDKVVIYWS